VARAKRGANSAASGSSPRGAARTSITLDAKTRDQFDRRLADLPLDRDALKAGMAAYGTSFDLVAFRNDFESRTASGRNRARLVTSNFQAVTDGMVELVREAATVTTARVHEFVRRLAGDLRNRLPLRTGVSGSLHRAGRRGVDPQRATVGLGDARSPMAMAAAMQVR
jgi:hypothetical protein